MTLQIRSNSDQVFQERFASTGATTAKVPHVFNSKAWIPLNTALANVQNEFVYAAEVSGVAKATGQAWVPGDKLYWDDTAKNLTTTSTSNTAFGYVLQAQASGDTTCTSVKYSAFT